MYCALFFYCKTIRGGSEDENVLRGAKHDDDDMDTVTLTVPSVQANGLSATSSEVQRERVGGGVTNKAIACQCSYSLPSTWPTLIRHDYRGDGCRRLKIVLKFYNYR